MQSNLHFSSEGSRDLLYAARVNPIVAFPGQGIILFGDKTGLGYQSAFDRINVRRLFLVIEEAIADSAKSILFELNDEFTQQFRMLSSLICARSSHAECGLPGCL